MGSISAASTTFATQTAAGRPAGRLDKPPALPCRRVSSAACPAAEPAAAQIISVVAKLPSVSCVSTQSVSSIPRTTSSHVCPISLHLAVFQLLGGRRSLNRHHARDAPQDRFVTLTSNVEPKAAGDRRDTPFLLAGRRPIPVSGEEYLCAFRTSGCGYAPTITVIAHFQWFLRAAQIDPALPSLDIGPA